MMCCEITIFSALYDFLQRTSCVYKLYKVVLLNITGQRETNRLGVG